MFDVFHLISTFKKRIKASDILISVCLILVYFITRTILLTSFPIFSDEGIYIHWSKIAWHDATWRFISLTDGRQPLQTWATIPLLKLFHNNYLVGGRMFGVLSGFLGMLGVFTLSRYLFNKRVGYIAALLFIVTPFYLFFDRLAMIDSMVNAAAVWIFFFSILLFNTLRLDVAFILGMVSGFGLLAKSNVSLFLGMAIFAPLLSLQKKFDLKSVINYLILYGFSVILAFFIYNIQRLSPFLHFVGEKNKTFVLTFSEWIHNPFQLFFHNLPLIPLYTAHNLGWATFILGCIGFFLLFKKDRILSYYFGLWIFIPYIIISFFLKVLYSRYHIFLLIPFIVLSAYLINELGLSKLKFKKFILSIIFISYFFAAYFDYTVIFKPADIPFLPTDRGQYIEGWPSGFGMKEIVTLLKEKGQAKPIIILAEGNFGMSADVLDVFIKDTDNVVIKGYWPLSEKELRDNQKDLKTHSIYALYAHPENINYAWPIKLVHEYKKPGGKSSLYLFELTQ